MSLWLGGNFHGKIEIEYSTETESQFDANLSPLVTQPDVIMTTFGDDIPQISHFSRSKTFYFRKQKYQPLCWTQLGNNNIYLHFLYFLNIDKACVAEFLARERQGHVHSI